MTQILTALTREHVLLASDRQLTFIEGDKKGQVAEDNACKLVSLWHLFGIGYAGAAQLELRATHEWIATTIAAARVHNIDEATLTLAERAAAAVALYPPHLRRLTLVVAGWEHFESSSGLSPHVCVVSNAHDQSGRALAEPTKHFERHILVLRPDADNSVVVIGEPLDESRRAKLKRNLRRLYDREAGPSQAMRLLVDEIANTHRHGHGTVGGSVLAFCIPRKSVENYLRTGSSAMAGILPVESCATFAYFESGYSKLRQHAPTIVSGDQGAVIEGIENDPITGGIRRMSFRMLASS